METELAWPQGPQYPVLGPDDVHVWSMNIDVLPELRVALEGHLSIDERNRAQRFAFARDAERYVASHGLLRKLLAAYLGTHPSAIRFLIGEFGKPLLEQDGAHGGVSFNLSHSGGIALCAVTRGREVGIDVEHVRPIAHMERIAARFFSANEYGALSALCAEQRERAFYACWSRKEAYIKGIGRGLSLALDSFDVSGTPGVHTTLLDWRGDAGPPTPWRLHEFFPAREYSAALAVEGPECEIMSWRWPGAASLGGAIAA